ncbi:MAG: hypothetical protein ABFR82_05790 [Nitrospirota bacterium]
MKKFGKKCVGSVMKSICIGIIITGAALLLSIPQTALGALEKDNSITSDWQNGIANAVEKEVRSNDRGVHKQTFLSKLFFSDEKNVYDIIKKIVQSEDKMYSKE